MSILGASLQAHTETQQVLRQRTLSARVEQPRRELCPELTRCVDDQMAQSAYVRRHHVAHTAFLCYVVGRSYRHKDLAW